MPLTIVPDTSQRDYIEVVPADTAHAADLPATVVSALGKLSPGSVLVTNKLSKPVTAIFAIWTYVDATGDSQQLKYACDGYHLSPVKTVVQAQGAVLLYPTGCTSDAQFSRLASGHRVLTPSEFEVSAEKAISQAATVNVTIDAVLYNDGEIRGKDKEGYYRRIQQRFEHLTAFLSAVDSAQAAGAPLATAVDGIRTSTEGARDPVLSAKWGWAMKLQASPDMAATLRYLRTYEAPPVFYHTGTPEQ